MRAWLAFERLGYKKKEISKLTFAWESEHYIIEFRFHCYVCKITKKDTSEDNNIYFSADEIDAIRYQFDELGF